jgi:hypothetical protein
MKKLLVMLLVGGMSLFGMIGSTSASPVIYEVYYDQTGEDGTEVFTELYNPGPTVDLTGWSLLGVNGLNGEIYRSVSLTGMISVQNQLLLIACPGSSIANADLYADVDWQNGPDAVQLRDQNGVVIDAVQYGSATANAGEGTPALDVSPGKSLSRDIFAADSDDNLSDFSVSVPSPGIGPATVPLPGAGWLLASGIAALAGLRRRQ